ncbi:TonB-dependent receptor domain-containing protein [Chryseobacterium arthrosphaerae]|uniref:TonB-dependent receptor domain-containing protein n=1 Tax=Chryseobacterium arthrosphaerae TaxID=651561 RepID=UPI003D346D12
MELCQNFLLRTLFIFLSISLSAQKVSVHGKVVNEQNEPVKYINISLLQNGNTKIEGALTDDSGNFSLSVNKGNYTLSVEQLGKQFFKNKINIQAVTNDVGIIRINEYTSIDGVTITVEKKIIERKVDRLVYNVENAVSALGGTATDVLKSTPGVNISENAISIIGRSTVNILIDDRLIQLSGESLISYLKSIPSERIQKIEVITNPPAKYDAAGNSGLINIQLKPLPKENSWNAVLNSASEFATFPTLSHGGNFSYKKNKFSLLAGINYRYGNKIYTNDIDYLYPGNEQWTNDIYNKKNTKNLGTLLNLKYDISEKSTLGLQYSGSFINASTFEDNISKNYIGGILAKDYVTNGNTVSKARTNAVNMNYNQKLDTLGKKYSIDLDYFNSVSPKENEFVTNQNDIIGNTSQDIFANNTGRQQIQNYSGKIDFDMPYSWAALSFGAKAGFTKTKNEVDAQFFHNLNGDPPYNWQRDNFEYTENIQALYISADKNLSDKWSVKLGLRGEYTQATSNSIITGQVNKNRYFKLFPTAYLLYKMNKNNSLSLDFGRRIGRPAFWELNPARWYMNTQSYTEGNPFLQPAFSYDIELNYSYKSILNAGIYYSKTEDGFGQVTFHDTNDGTQVFKRLNYYNATDIGFWTVLTFKPLPWWEATITASAFYKESDNYIPLFNRDFSGWGGYTKSTNLITLNKNKTLFLNVDYHYNYAGKNRETSYTGYSYLDIGFKGLLFKKKLVLGVNFEDVLKENISTFSSVSGAVQQSFTQYYDTRLVRFSLTYNFGNNKISVGKRNVGNQDERNRTNQ